MGAVGQAGPCFGQGGGFGAGQGCEGVFSGAGLGREVGKGRFQLAGLAGEGDGRGVVGEHGVGHAGDLALGVADLGAQGSKAGAQGGLSAVARQQGR